MHRRTSARLLRREAKESVDLTRPPSPPPPPPSTSVAIVSLFLSHKGWSLTIKDAGISLGRDDIFRKFLILPTTTFFPLVLSMVSRKKKKVSPKLTGRQINYWGGKADLGSSQYEDYFDPKIFEKK